MAEGGCLCGAVRYRVDGPPVDAGYCHCRLCQRSAGAPAVPWGTWREEAFAWTKGQPAVHASTRHGRRAFCASCGTPLSFRSLAQPGFIDITLASLDDPLLFPPEYHTWTASRIGWFETADDLPRHPDDGPDRHGRD
ncbi:MAG: GFA family protein [Geminicoccaceae bacterium]